MCDNARHKEMFGSLLGQFFAYSTLVPRNVLFDNGSVVRCSARRLFWVAEHHQMVDNAVRK